MAMFCRQKRGHSIALRTSVIGVHFTTLCLTKYHAMKTYGEMEV